MNHKGSSSVAIIVLVVILLGVTGYIVLSNRLATPDTNPQAVNETPANWQFVNANSFTLSLPPGWKFNKLQGIDSYVGEFVGDGAVLGFDYGWYSNSLVEDNDPKHLVTYEMIGGYQAKIVIPKVTGNGTTGVYFGDLGMDELQKTSFQLSGADLTAPQQELALKIFHTLQFKK